MCYTSEYVPVEPGERVKAGYQFQCQDGSWVKLTQRDLDRFEGIIGKPVVYDQRDRPCRKHL